MCGKGCWRAFQQHFPYKSFKFPENLSCCIKSSFAQISTKLGNSEKTELLHTRPEWSPTGTSNKNISFALSSIIQKLFFYAMFVVSMPQIGQKRSKMSRAFRGS